MDSFLIVGTGALAMLFAARFSGAKIPFTMLGNWPEGLAALRDHGVRLMDQDGGEKSFPVHVVSGKAKPSAANLALVLVKSWQTERAARQLENRLAPDGLVLTLQNGLGNREILMQTLGEGRVALGVTTTGATLLAAGRVRPGGEGMISLERRSRIGLFEEMFTRAGFEVETVDQVDSLVWGKLVINAAINPLTAILRVANGELLASAPMRALMAAAAQETALVAEKMGIALPFANPVRVVEDVARRTAANHSSMLQDVTRGAPTEIDAICGAVVRAGEALGAPTPVNRTLWMLVRAVVGR